ncbi:hypothetical protein [Fontivita pretiosa]|uniref:hypothetical protein n=1 Tax=Fontivita pretiosa TaxID=2989684 RepID=UPI003D17EC73
MISVKGVVEAVEEAQAAFAEFWQGEVHLLRQSLGLKYDATTEFDRVSMKDEAEFFGLLMQLVQQGIIDHETAIETMDLHFPTISKRMEKIRMLQKQGKGIFVPVQVATQSPEPKLPPKGGIPSGPKGGKPS